ncbi:sugar porter family MFS transporter [Elizabethkingia bruuniana]|uniref:Sugar porter family MFS transporter n=1 Tax=Elizabethkingia bruuniana TaxID=1756149 RepID=A0A7T7V2J7_9FLAO|nr:sugar porter family MFS transporter [Elizabethkingia bruuniana]KGO08207.1 MFS transporter [Elizabethkingia miricola]AQX86981.1 MFS transporter [Elizabethkingia bruuniana]KUY26773.1 MFS transporter [Elizabethkingia bruuniana]OPB66785.1 MFS transporter [Elizabethkingia bruuniana]QDZ63885.1 MFS transporter [Elizabethkingia bruuniana]
MQSAINSGIIYKATLVASVGGLLFGYDTAVISGAIGFMRSFYNLSDIMTGWVASCALLGCIAGAMYSGKLSDCAGRKKILMLSAVLFTISSIGTAIAPNLWVFVLFRIIGGMGIGIASMLSPMYISEMAPASVRGRLISVFQLGIVTGILVIYFVNAYIAGIHNEAWNISTGWRWMFGSGVIPSIIFILLLLTVPESPRWLASQKKQSEALAILSQINGNTAAQKELNSINESLKDEAPFSLATLKGPKLKKALITGIFLAVFSQFTGINAIMYYAPEIFKSTGTGTDSAFIQTILVGVINVAFTLVAIKYVDSWGRKKLLLSGISGMTICLFIVGLAFYTQQQGYLVLIAILGYIAFFAMSLGPLTFVVIAEIFPTRSRATAMSIATFFLWLAVFLVSQTFPILIGSIGSAYTFWLYTLISVLTFLFIRKSIPETKGKTLEEIEASWTKE